MNPEHNDRVTARIPCSVKRTLEQAAAMLGTPLNQFMVQASLRAAQEVIQSEQRVQLGRRDVRALFDCLDQPAPANEALTEAARRHRALTAPD